MRKLIIYFNAEKTSFQVVSPCEQFNNDWHGLAQAISGGRYHSYEIS